MARQVMNIDDQIERLRAGGTLTENEVKDLCEKVRSSRERTGKDQAQPPRPVSGLWGKWSTTPTGAMVGLY